MHILGTMCFCRNSNTADDVAASQNLIGIYGVCDNVAELDPAPVVLPGEVRVPDKAPHCGSIIMSLQPLPPLAHPAGMVEMDNLRSLFASDGPHMHSFP